MVVYEPSPTPRVHAHRRAHPCAAWLERVHVRSLTALASLRSNPEHVAILDCFVALLLAMTRDMLRNPHPARRFASSRPSPQGGGWKQRNLVRPLPLGENYAPSTAARFSSPSMR